MSILILLLFVVVITIVNIVFSIVGMRFRRAFVFVPAFITLAISAYFFLTSLQMDDLGALASALFGIVFLMSGVITLIAATIRYLKVN